MSTLDPHSLQEDERWLLYLTLNAQRLIDRGIATCERSPCIMPPKLQKKVERMIRDYPHLFESYASDTKLWELGMATLNARYGLVVDERKLLDEMTVVN